MSQGHPVTGLDPSSLPASPHSRAFRAVKQVGPFARFLRHVVGLLLGLLINPRWYLWNRPQIARLRRRRRAMFLGAGKIMYWWPVISAAVICDLCLRCGVPAGALGFAYITVVLLALVVMAFDVTRHSFGWVLFGVCFPLLIAVVLQLGFQVHVTSDIGRFLSSFHPDYPRGFANLLAFALFVFQVIDVGIAWKRNSLAVEGNNYIPHIGIGFEAELSHGTHAVFEDKGRDFMEAAPPFYCGTLYLRNRTGGDVLTSGGTPTLHDASAVVYNMAGALQVKRAIDDAMGDEDVQAVASPPGNS